MLKIVLKNGVVVHEDCTKSDAGACIEQWAFRKDANDEVCTSEETEDETTTLGYLPSEVALMIWEEGEKVGIE